jgi:hypothetical protein
METLNPESPTATPAAVGEYLHPKDALKVVSGELTATWSQIIKTIIDGPVGTKHGDGLRAYLQVLTIQRLDTLAQKMDALIALTAKSHK